MIVLLALLVAPFAVAAAAAASFYAFCKLTRLRRRRYRARHLHTLSDREVADALAPFGADISIWPSRAPRNGSAYDPIE